MFELKLVWLHMIAVLRAIKQYANADSITQYHMVFLRLRSFPFISLLPSMLLGGMPTRHRSCMSSTKSPTITRTSSLTVNGVCLLGLYKSFVLASMLFRILPCSMMTLLLAASCLLELCRTLLHILLQCFETQ